MSRSPKSKAAAEAAALEKEFLAAYEQYADALLRHALLRVRDRDLARDIVQETFAKTWLYLSERNKIEYMKAFLYRVANNLIVDHSRKKKSSSLDKMMDDDGFEINDENLKHPSEIGDARAAVKLLDSLEEIYRTVISMRFLDGLTPKEISSALNISENVVSVRLHRGVEQLKKLVNRVPGGA